jgi:hypothetical protein
MDEQAVYEGPIGNTGHTLRVIPIENHMHRGILTILGEEGSLLYQKEVSIDRMKKDGGDSRHFEEWRRVVSDWFIGGN